MAPRSVSGCSAKLLKKLAMLKGHKCGSDFKEAADAQAFYVHHAL